MTVFNIRHSQDVSPFVKISTDAVFGHREVDKERCGGLTLAGYLVPTMTTLSLPSSTGQRRENRTKSTWVKIKTEEIIY